MRTATFSGPVQVTSDQVEHGEAGKSMFEDRKPDQLKTIASEEEVSAGRGATGNVQQTSDANENQPKTHQRAEEDTSAISDVDANKREVDQDIAQELRHQEVSYNDQIASLEINNSGKRKNESQDQRETPSAPADESVVD